MALYISHRAGLENLVGRSFFDARICLYMYIYIHSCTDVHTQTATDLAVLWLDVEHSQKTTLKSFWILHLAGSSDPRIWRDETGWRRTIGCLALQVAFRKRATNYRALLRKMTYKDKASYGSAPPCSSRRQDQIFECLAPGSRAPEKLPSCILKYHHSMLQGGDDP